MRHLVVSLISVDDVILTIVDILDITNISDVDINSMSVIMIVIATDISVDHVVHISRTFFEPMSTRRKRTC